MTVPPRRDEVTAPPYEPPWSLLRRTWNGRGQLVGLKYWILFRGVPVLMVFCLLFVVNGVVLGWRTAYDVMLAITSPAATGHPVLAWFLSFSGWLIGPAVAGAAAGAVISEAIAAHRRREYAELFAEGRDG